MGRLAGALKYPRDEPTQDKEIAAEELSRTARDIDLLSAEGVPPDRAGWIPYTNQLIQCCRSRNPANFIQWRVIRGTMFVDASPYLKMEYEFLRSEADFEEKWLPAITENWVGRPPRFWLDGRTSGHRVNLAYHLARFREATGLEPSDFDSIYEFGGGYGCMCDALHRMGFAGRYVAVDLPVQVAMQRYYFRRNGLNLVTIDQPGPGILCADSPELAAEAVSQLTGRTLFIATWSISETPLEVRQSPDCLTRDFDACLIGYLKNFQKIDNDAYFREWQANRSHMDFQRMPLDHAPGSCYLFGARRPPDLR